MNFFLWSRVHRLPRVFIERWQVAQLRRVADLAFHHVPFYRELFDAHGISPRDIKTLTDIRCFPVTNKQILRDRPLREIMHNSFPRESYAWERTSGSTGEPFRFPVAGLGRMLHDQRFADFSNYRFLFWSGRRGGGLRTGDMKAGIGVARIRIEPCSDTHGYLFVPMADLRRDPQSVFRQLSEFKPRVLESVATALVELARFTKEHCSSGEKLRIPYLVSYGETLSRGARACIEHAFGGEVYNLYGIGETRNIGVECGTHDGFHIYEESFIVEILDENDRPLSPGVEGRVVVTYFYNDVMPLIRYDTGDRGTVVEEPCSCGLSARRLRVGGRAGGVLTIGGRTFNHIELVLVLDRFDQSILKYQIAKVGGDKLEIRITPSAQFSNSDSEQLRAQFIKNFALDPAIKLVDPIPASQSGKTPVIVDETTR